MKIKKRFLAIPAIIGAVLAVGAFAAPTVQAHDGTASGTCNGGVQWSYSNYDKTVTNTIKVTIDGTVRYQDLDFKASDAGQIATDKTKAHTWKVDVVGPLYQDDKGVWHDPQRHPSGSYAACVAAPTTTVAATTTTQATTTTVAATTTVPAVTTTLPGATTTSVVEVITPPVPCAYNPTVPADSPLCVPPVAEDVVALTPDEPRLLPATGGDAFGFVIAGLLVAAGIVVLAIQRLRVCR